MSQMPVTPGYQAPPPNKPAGLAIASMVLGIIAVPFMCVWYVSIPCGIIAVVLGFVAKGKIARGEAGGSGMATTGVVLGIIAVALAVLVIILFIAGVSWVGGKVKELEQEQRRRQQNGTSMMAPALTEHVCAVWNIFSTLVLK